MTKTKCFSISVVNFTWNVYSCTRAQYKHVSNASQDIMMHTSNGEGSLRKRDVSICFFFISRSIFHFIIHVCTPSLTITDISLCAVWFSPGTICIIIGSCNYDNVKLGAVCLCACVRYRWTGTANLDFDFPSIFLL